MNSVVFGTRLGPTSYTDPEQFGPDVYLVSFVFKEYDASGTVHSVEVERGNNHEAIMASVKSYAQGYREGELAKKEKVRAIIERLGKELL